MCKHYTQRDTRSIRGKGISLKRTAPGCPKMFRIGCAIAYAKMCDLCHSPHFTHSHTDFRGARCVIVTHLPQVSDRSRDDRAQATLKVNNYARGRWLFGVLLDDYLYASSF